MHERKAISEDVGATDVQGRAAEVSAYVTSMRIIKTTANKHAKKEHGFLGRRKYRREIRRELATLYVASVSPQAELSQETTGTQAEDIFESISSRLAEVRSKAHEDASELGKIRRAKIATEAILLINKLPEEPSKQLLRAAGYSNTEAKFVRGKLATSAGLGLVTGGIAFAGVIAATVYEKLHPIIQNINDTKLLLSYAAFYGSTALAALTNKSLLDDPLIKTSANLFPTAGYYLLPTQFSEKWKKMNERTGTVMGTFAPNLFGELTTWGIVGSFAGLQGVIGRNMGSTIAELATAAGNLTWLHVARRRAKNSLSQ